MNFLNGFLLCFTFLLISCSDHRPPQPQQFRLKKTVAINSQGSTTTILDYNAEGRLTSFSSGDQTYNIQYDALSRFSNVHLAGNTNAIVRRFIYDANGNLNIIYNYRYTQDLGSELLSSTLFRYTGTRYPTFSYFSDGSSPRDLQSAYTFEAGNLIKLERSINYPSQTEYLDSVTYQYDDKPNPYFGLLPLGISIGESLSQNNALVPTDQLIYNSDDLVAQKNINIAGDVSARSTITFEYEAY